MGFAFCENTDELPNWFILTSIQKEKDCDIKITDKLYALFHFVSCYLLTLLISTPLPSAGKFNLVSSRGHHSVLKPYIKCSFTFASFTVPHYTHSLLTVKCLIHAFYKLKLFFFPVKLEIISKILYSAYFTLPNTQSAVDLITVTKRDQKSKCSRVYNMKIKRTKHIERKLIYIYWTEWKTGNRLAMWPEMGKNRNHPVHLTHPSLCALP